MTSVVGTRFAHVLARVTVTAILSVGIAGPLRDVAVASDTGGPIAAPMPVHADPIADLPDRPAPKGFTDEAARVSFDPPVGWVREPSEALNPLSDPPDPAQELVRFQLRAGDPSLYLLPVPITSALVRDAGAIISVGLARAGGDMVDLDVDPRTDRAIEPPISPTPSRESRIGRLSRGPPNGRWPDIQSPDDPREGSPAVAQADPKPIRVTSSHARPIAGWPRAP